MPRFNEVVSTATSVLAYNPRQSIYISGQPGCGKTAAIHAVFDKLGIERENQHIFRPSLHDPVDLLGVPSVNEKATHWNTPAWLQVISTGKHGLGVDELPQAVAMMQNALAGLILDRYLGEFTLSPEAVIIATGNRTKDKAGANRMVSQLANRVLHLEMESHLDDWADWALNNAMPTWLVAFLRFRPNLLSAFDPDRFSNPTERTWEMVGRLPALSGSALFTAISGLVGEGAAAEAVGFRKVMDAMPNPDAVMLDPEGSAVPDDPAALYAISGALAAKATKDSFDRVLTYLYRLPPEFCVMSVKDAIKLKPEVKNTRAFVQWAGKYAQVVF